MSDPKIIIIGAGHAGCEAAHACAKMGVETLLLTMTIDNIAQMSCNPAIGGVAKGHLVKEIDALGGIMGVIADETGIQFRRLNTSKGAAVQATRCQSDMLLYKIRMRDLLENLPNLSVKQREVVSLIRDKGRVTGVRTSMGEELRARAVIITTGTFLNGKIHIGHEQFPAGRAWEFPSSALSEDLQDSGLIMGRLKTGTTPRLNKHTIDFSRLEEQNGDDPIPLFSKRSAGATQRQVPCHITFTNTEGHDVIRENLDKSAMYGGFINSVGPRYCPSIEDKVVKFPDKDRHQIFLEPTSLSSTEIYPNGMSTSMPYDVQLKFMRSIVGLEKVEIMRPGYAIEYDFCFPHQLKPTLETKDWAGLFLAGQINGTTGYEEAAAQGLAAAINAVSLVQEKDEVVFTRDNSYIGVLIDDLITKGTEEPYRMFTSRAEYRLLLREDNADRRLSPLGHSLGLLDEKAYEIYQKRQDALEKLGLFLEEEKFRPGEEAIRHFASKSVDLKPVNVRFAELLKQPGLSIAGIHPFLDEELKSRMEQWKTDEWLTAETDILYRGYVKRQENQLRSYKRLDAVRLPEDLDYSLIGGLSSEVREKLSAKRPPNLGQAAKISGITPAAVSIIFVYLKNRKLKRAG